QSPGQVVYRHGGLIALTVKALSKRRSGTERDEVIQTGFYYQGVLVSLGDPENGESSGFQHVFGLSNESRKRPEPIFTGSPRRSYEVGARQYLRHSVFGSAN